MTTYGVKWGILSSSPPTACGIATFTTALGRALSRRGGEVSLVENPPRWRSASFVAVPGLLAIAR